MRNRRLLAADLARGSMLVLFARMHRIALVLTLGAMVALAFSLSPGVGSRGAARSSASTLTGTATVPTSRELASAASQHRRAGVGVTVQPASTVSNDVPGTSGRSQPQPIAQTGNGVSSTPSPAASTSQPQLIVITEADSGKTFNLVTSSRVVLRLSNRFVWTVPRVDGVAVRLTPVSYFRDPGYQEWEISVIGVGRATITSSGTPNCVPGSTCPEGGVQFEIVLTVSS